MRGRFLFVAAAYVCSGSPLFAQEVEQQRTFQPDGQWRLNTLEDGCSVARDFTRGEERVTFSIKRIHPRSAVQFAVIGAPILQQSGSLEAGFVPGKELHRFGRVAAA
ncbi:hypothetical protein ED21_19807 [Erythrobacter sp. SD-21]|nr:hypothetical protein ED21_19807 [Erythrobacter sp. SD-21]